ncbi:MAG: CHAP domain-containing protein [Clostridia bacterium]|nr:CHAP domain-containing protein [Clostridia bacterium]MBQ9211166.1 CHAP domain-containing protein [Clostridia bacterium]
MSAVDKVLAVAGAEVGYLEKETKNELDDKTANAGDENITKYARDMDGIPWFYNGRKQGIAWCDVFVDWCFMQAFGADKARELLCQPKKSSGAGCNSSMGYYRKAGRLFSSPCVGDQVFFWSSEYPNQAGHTGIVEKVTSTRIYTIEGNTTGASNKVANGGGVARKNYTIGYGRIAGFGRPDYSLVEEKESGGGEKMSYTAKVVAQSGKTVNLREKANGGSKVIYQVPIGATVYMEGSSGEWTRCTYEAPDFIHTGYMMSKFLQEIPDEHGDAGGDGEYITVKKADLLAVYDLLDKMLFGDSGSGDSTPAVG